VTRTNTQRVQFIDFMRGFAVIVMVMGHSIDSVLGMEARATDAFRIYDAIRGFTAPLFLFISGLANYIVTTRRWDDYVSFGKPMRARIQKMLLLLGLGYALHFPFFSLNKILHHTTQQEVAQMLQVDVLHCLAVSVIILQALFLIGRTHRGFFVVGTGFTLAAVFLGPFLWGGDLAPVVGPVVAPYLNQFQASIFPVFPFGGYVFAGALAGWLYVEATRGGHVIVFAQRVMLITLAAAMLGMLADFLPFTPYPAYDAWRGGPAMFMIRLSVVLLVTAGFFFLRNLPVVVSRNLVTLGQASLVVYVVHLVLVYGSAANDGLMQLIGQRLWVTGALAVAVGVLLTMVLLVHAWRYVKREHGTRWRMLQAGLASILIYFFLTKPY
jgi:surface polysaccharide O-acyltransferase-like enzyme